MNGNTSVRQYIYIRIGSTLV